MSPPDTQQAPHNIALLAFDGLQILDITGPAAVFAAANDACGRAHYRVLILSAEGGIVQSNSAIQITTLALNEVLPSSVHTLLIMGGTTSCVRQLADNIPVRAWVLAATTTAQRYGSICSGAIALGAFGLLAGKRVTSHWECRSDLARENPEAMVDSDALYIQDGSVWTSAGVTTGIDMCLAIVEQDLGSAVTQEIAERLVLYARRPGYQSQFSPILSAQARAGTQFSELINWMIDNLTDSLDVSSLAARVHMSDRNFHRKFTEAVDETPAHFVETLRLDQARSIILANGSLKEIAAKTGFATPVQFTKAFERRFGISPAMFREMHGVANVVSHTAMLTENVT